MAGSDAYILTDQIANTSIFGSVGRALKEEYFFFKNVLRAIAV